MNLAVYSRYDPDTPPVDPRDTDSMEAIRAAIASIVEAEGPILMPLVIRRYIQATPDLSRAGGTVRSTLTRAAEQLAARGDIEMAFELGEESPDRLVLHTADQQVTARTRDDRTLQEVPLSELAAAFLQVRRKLGMARYTERVQRQLLTLLGLKRLTEPTRERLLLAWRIADRWSNEQAMTGRTAAVETRSLPPDEDETRRRPSGEQSLPPGVMPWQAAMQSGPVTIRPDDE